MAENGDGPLDRFVLESLADLSEGGDRTLLRDLHALFAEDTPIHLRTLRDAAASGDTEGLWFSAHTIKGSAGTLGATEMADLCRRIEDSALMRDLPEATRLVDELDREATKVTQALARAIEES
jgi:HPt (histidine-containing phosphotransfer) domain-containing protein